ncbi:MAG: hypothetical protein ACE5KT_00935 [Methanosarcinales archaeon]
MISIIGKRRISVDLNIPIEIALNGTNKKEAKKFFDLMKSYPTRLELFLSPHFTKITPNIKKLLDKYGVKRGNRHKYYIYLYERDFNTEKIHKFASSANVNQEDVYFFIGSFLMNCDYIVTFNLKQCNKLTEIKNTGWCYGIEVPDIISVPTFLHLMKFLL